MKFYATWTKFTKKCESVVVVINAKGHVEIIRIFGQYLES